QYAGNRAVPLFRQNHAPKWQLLLTLRTHPLNPPFWRCVRHRGRIRHSQYNLRNLIGLALVTISWSRNLKLRLENSCLAKAEHTPIPQAVLESQCREWVLRSPGILPLRRGFADLRPYQPIKFGHCVAPVLKV